MHDDRGCVILTDALFFHVHVLIKVVVRGFDSCILLHMQHMIDEGTLQQCGNLRGNFIFVATLINYSIFIRV